MVEAAGIEPASEEAEAQVSTCVVPGGILPLRSPGTDADERPARKVSRVGPGHAFTASSQKLTPRHRPCGRNRWGTGSLFKLPVRLVGLHLHLSSQ